MDPMDQADPNLQVMHAALFGVVRGKYGEIKALVDDLGEIEMAYSDEIPQQVKEATKSLWWLLKMYAPVEMATDPEPL